jgi:hypothetical protein
MIADVWDSLRSDNGQSAGVVMRRVLSDAPIDVFAAMRKPRNVPMLIVEMPTKALPLNFPVSSRGFSINVVPTEAGPMGRVTVELELADPTGEPVFMALVDDAITRVEGAGDSNAAAAEFAHALARWQAFFRVHAFDGLTKDQQQGLFGELLFLRTRLVMAGSAAAAVKAWGGPSGSNQDFEWAGHAFEVKTTASNPLTAIRISNLRQLDDACVESLHLVVIEVERHENALQSLPQAVDATRALIAESAPQVAFDLAERLIDYGYLDQQAGHYAGMGYGVRTLRAFRVVEGFPRLVESDVPNGVGDVHYAVALSAIIDFEVDDATMTEQMRKWFGELG